MSPIDIGSDGRTRLGFDGHHQPRAASRAEVEELRSLVAQLRDGMATRQLIGVATGLVAQRFHCTTEQAWSVLARVSQHTNIKLREVARVIVDAHDGQPRDEDIAILAEVSAQLPGGWPGHRPAKG